MTSENAQPGAPQPVSAASENRTPLPPQPTSGPSGRRRGATATPLPAALATVLADYTITLERAPVSAETRRTYASKVRQYLAWLAAESEVGGDPLTDPRARDWAVRDYRTWLLTAAVPKRAPATVNNALAAIDDFYTRRGLGPAAAERLDLPDVAPRALGKRATLRWLRAVEACPSPRDRALAGIPLYAGARIGEVVRMDLDDVRLSARKGTLRLLGKGQRPRTLQVHAQLRADLRQWLDERPTWPGAEDNPALFLNHRGGRLSARGASGVIADIAEAAALDDPASAHTLRHTCATILVRGGTDLVTVAAILGHARLETTRTYSKPTEEDHLRALELLPVDR
jgi:site-specific recombinase XerD